MCMVCQHYKLRIMPQVRVRVCACARVHCVSGRVASRGMTLVVSQPLKRHPKDWETRGRVKVQLKDAAGNFTHDEIHTSTLLAVGNRRHQVVIFTLARAVLQRNS